MSLCPHHLLRSRFSAGLQRRLRLGHGYQHRGNAPVTRGLVDDASKASVSSSHEIGVVDHDLDVPAGPRNTSTTYEHSASAAQPTSTEENFDVGSPDTPRYADIYQSPAESASVRYSPSGPRSLSLAGDRPVVGRDFRPRIVYNTLTVVNGELTPKQRLVSQETIDLERQIRAKSLFHDGEAVRQWRADYSEIYKAKFYGRDTPETLAFLQLNDEDRKLLARINTDCFGDFRTHWEGLDKKARSDHWMRLALWLTVNSPPKALEFLLVTCQGAERPVFIMVGDCLLYLDSFHSEELKRQSYESLSYGSAIETCLHPDTWPVLFLPQKATRLFIKRARPAGIYRAYKNAAKRRAHLRAETYLGFMQRFTEFKDIDSAIDVLRKLQSLRQHKFSINSQGVQRHCCKLLLLDSVVDEPEGRNFRILPRLLELGVRPDRDMMNVVLANAFKTGDPQLGQDMLNFMKSQDLQPDSYTYLTLLGDAVARGDRERVQSLVQEIRSQEKLQKNPWIASKIFHAHFLFTAKHADPDADPNSIFYSMLDMYNQLYDITPLKELAIIPPEYTPPPGGDNLPPSPVALYLVIATYLRCQKQIFNAQLIYSKYRSLVLRGHETIAPLAATDHTYNEFLVAFRNDPRGLRPSVRLVEDMLQSATEQFGQNTHNSTTLVAAKPTVRTWTILMSAFVFNRQPLAAEKVREMMAKHGVEYNMVTWNILISGYANAQNIPEVAKTIKAMEDQGYNIDAYTMKCLRYLRDPERLWVAVEELDKSSESDSLKIESALEPPGEEEHVVDNEALLDQGLQRLRERMEPKL